MATPAAESATSQVIEKPIPTLVAIPVVDDDDYGVESTSGA